LKNDSRSKAPFREKAIGELKEFAIVAVYLYVCFAALIYLKAAVLHGHGVVYTHLGLAAIKAALCAKFMLVGRAFHIGDRFKKHPLIWPTLYRSFATVVLLLVLMAIEESVVGAIHGRGISDSVAGIAGGTFEQTVAASVVVLLVLIPYFAFRSLGDVMDDKTLIRLFFQRRRETH